MKLLRLPMCFYLCLSIILSCIHGYVQAQTPTVENVQTEAFNAGKTLGESTLITSKQGISSSAATEYIQGFESSKSQANIIDSTQNNTEENLEDIIKGMGNTKSSACNTNPATGTAFDQQECDAIKFMTGIKNTTPIFTISVDDPLIANSKAIVESPQESVGTMFSSDVNNTGTLSGTYSNCTETIQTTPTETVSEFCYNFSSIDKNTCPITHDIQVEATHHYSCNKENKQITQQLCQRSLQMSCASGGNGCNSGDVVASGSTGEMSNSFTPEVSGNYALIFKTTRQNWSSAFINDQLVIDIKDINNIVEFKLNRVHYKEYLLLKIANVVLYAWPFAVQHGMKMDTLQPCFLGGDDYPSHLLIDSSKIFAKYKVGCVKRDRRNPIDTLVNIDIKPYLKNGRNIINMTGFEAYSGGFAHVYFTVRMKCPPKCTETWSNGCSALEARK